MKVVLIQHNNFNRKKYCFAVPEQLESHIRDGARVVCDTRLGHTFGRVASQVFSGGDAERIMVENNATLPLKNILAVINKVDISNVQVPMMLRNSKPHQEKLEKRMQELRDFGYVKTKVCVDDKNILRDGYTAYLLCKNCGMSFIPVAVGA